MILKTFDNKEIFVTPDQADNIAKAITAGAKLIKIGNSYVAAGAVATIMPGGVDPAVKRISAPVVKPYDPVKAKANLAWLRNQLIERGIL